MRTALLLLALGSSTALAAAPTDPIDPGGGTIDPIDYVTACQTNISAKYNLLARMGINLGAQVGTLQMVGRNDWCYQAFEFGRIHTDPYAVSTAAIHGAVLTKYLALGAETGWGRTVVDATRTSSVTQQGFVGGSIIVHPTFGTRAIPNPLAAMWQHNGGGFGRFGFPITDQIANPFGLGAYSRLERGYVARTDDMGTWIDFTGAGEGRVNATLQLYRDAALLGTSLSRSLSGESPVALRAQLGTLDNLTSSLSLTMPTRTSLYLFDLSPLEGRYTRITGADSSVIRVSNIGTWMNDRTSSMLFANHGTASSRTSTTALASQIQASLDTLPTAELIKNALAGKDATGSLSWSGGVAVSLLPGERLLQFTRRAYINIDAGCLVIFNCNADGYVDFTIAVRPFVASDRSVHVQLVEGTAVSVTCSGEACDDRNTALATLFDSLSVRQLVEANFNSTFDTRLTRVGLLQGPCPEVGVRRVNLLPDALEIVVADTAAAAACARPFDTNNELDYARPVGRVTNHGFTGGLFPQPAPAFDGTVTVIPFLDPGPIVVK